MVPITLKLLTDFYIIYHLRINLLGAANLQRQCIFSLLEGIFGNQDGILEINFLVTILFCWAPYNYYANHFRSTSLTVILQT